MTVTRRFALLLALAGLSTAFSVPAFAQDFGDAGFDPIAEVATGAGFMGGSNNTDNGVVQLAPVVTGSGGYVSYTVTVSAIGNLSVWLDADDDGDFEDEVEQSFAVTAGVNHIEVQIGAAAATAETFVRFIYEDGTNLVNHPNTDFSATVNGEIEDWELEILAAASDVVINTLGGGTTTVSTSGGLFQVTRGGNEIFSSLAANIDEVTIEGDNAADDLFVVDFNAFTATSGGVTVDGNGQAISDALQVNYGGAGSLGSVVHTAVDASSGSVLANGQTINYTGLEPVTDNIPAVSRTFNFTAGADAIVMTEAGGAGDDVISIDSNNSEIVTFDVSATTSITINAGADADTITIDDLDTAFTGAAISVNGEAGTDVLTLDLASDGPLGHASVAFDGGLGIDDLILDSNTYGTATVNFAAATIGVGAANDVTFTSADDIDIDLALTNMVFTLTGAAETPTLGDDGVGGNSQGQLTLGGVDVVFNTPSSTITLNAGSGNDTVLLQQIDSAYANAVVVNGDAGVDQLRVDFTNDPIPGSLTWAGGSESDSIEIFNGALAASITHAGLSAASGTITTPEGLISYSQVEGATQDNRTATTRNFTGTGGADAITLEDDGLVGNNIGSYDADTSPQILFAVSATTTININAGGGADTIITRQVDSLYGGALNVNGEGGNDENRVDFTNDPIPGAFTFDGGAQTDNIEIFGGALAASITHTGTSNSAGTITTPEGVVTYLNVENPTEDNRTATARVFTGTAVVDNIDLDDDGTGGNDIGSFDSDNSPEIRFNVAATTNVTINAGAGNDDIDAFQIDSNYSGSVVINGEDDDDHLEVHFGSGDPLPAGGFTFDGGAGGSNSDTLELDDGGNQGTVTYSDTGADAGTIVSAGAGTLTYTDVESGITDDLLTTHRVFTYTQGAETIEVDDTGGTNNNRDLITSTLAQSVTFRPATSTLTINAGTGDDAIIVNDLDDQFSGNIFVNGDGGDDTLTVDWENNANSPLGGIGSFAYDGGAHTTGDDLFLSNGSVSYVTHTYADANSGTVEVAAVSDQMTYANIEPIVDGLVAVTRTFNFSGVDDEIFLDSDFGGGTSQIVTPSPNLPGQNSDVITSEVTTFNDTGTTSVIINGGAGSDVFDIEASDQYTVSTDGQLPTTLTPGDQITLNVAALPNDEKITLAESSNTAGTYSFAKQGGGASIYKDVSYTNMELVTLRFSDPNAFAGSTYEGDWVYPVPGESGISVEPYFNWDIEINQALPGGHPSKYTDLQLDLSLSSDLSSPVFTTNTKEDGATLLIDSEPDEDHYITDLDRDAGILLQNFTEYWWGLTATMTGGQIFCQIQRFTTVDELQPELDYPDDELTIYDLDYQFDWNVAHPADDDVYWRIELDNVVSSSFLGDIPPYDDGVNPVVPSVQGLLMGEDKNDNDLAVTDGFAALTEFESSDLPTPLAWGTTYSWRVATMWPVPPTGWVPQEIHDKHETDRLVGVSDVAQFQTVTKAFVPTLTYPVDDLEIYANDPVLSWNVGGPFAALTFDILISVQGGGPDVCEVGGLIAGVNGLQFDTADCSIPLVPGTTYDWQVRSSDGVTTSAYSGIESFTVLGAGVASAATPSYPVDDLEIYTTAPSMHWFTESDATGLSFVVWYEERVGPAAATCPDVKAGGTALPSVGVTQTEVSGLTPGATYDWCVVSTGSNGSFDSDVAVFSVAGGAADAYPIASWPVDNPTTYTLDQPLTWYVEGASLDITGYTVEYCVAPDGFGDPGCTTVAGLTDTEYEITGLDYGDIVTWRVKASYSSGPDSDWTQPHSQGSFTVTGELSSLSAVLTYPIGGQILHDDTANLSWYLNGATLPDGAVVYEVSWSYAEAFPTIGNITTTELTMDTFVEASNLIPGHTYWWRVRISIDGGVSFGSWSQLGSFEVHPGAGAVMPRVGSPTRSVTVATSNPVLSWILPTQSTSTLTYDLHVGQQPDLADATVYAGLTGTNHRLENLVSGQYYWAVRSHSADGTTSALSSVGTFVANGLFSTGVETEDDADDADSDVGSTDDGTTGDDDTTGSDGPEDRADEVNPGDEAGDVDRDVESGDEDVREVEDPSEQVLPDAWALGQNYPNPFNPTTTIEFSMPHAAGVSVRVYNMLGQVVKTLVNGTLPAGVHRLSWDATDEGGATVSSGMYLYRLESEAFQATKTLVLMK